MKGALPLALAAVLLAAPARAWRPYAKEAPAKAAWMTVSSIKTGQEYYLEVSQDGKAVMREETPTSLITRSGEIKKMFASDFFREIENSEIINSQNVADSKMIFYRGELLKISAYISGELTRTEAPLNKFGEAFSYAFGEVKKAAASLPEEKGLRAFLRAEPVTGDALESFQAKASADEKAGVIETSELMKIKPLMAAIKEPYRLIPIADEAALKEVQSFVIDKSLYGLRTLFYVPTTRGTFKCLVLDVSGAKARVAPGRKTPEKKKPAMRWTRPS